MLVGRQDECARLDILINQVRAGASGAIVLKGEAGIGKSSLLEYAADQAVGLRVLRARGVESEQNLPFAGLAGLVDSLLKHLDVLPSRQRAALAGALAVGPEIPSNRFAICAAVLALLAEAAAEQPVLALVDDAHWLDAASAQAMEFTARRLAKEAIGLVIAVRDDSASSLDVSGMESVAVTGLDRAAARQLLAETDRPITGSVADRLAEGVGGNPLALLELSATLTEAQLAGLSLLPEPLPVATTLERTFTQRLTAVGSAARRLLLLAAADATADLAALQRASELLSVDMGSFSAAEEAGLIRTAGSRVEFTHPLVRSAAYHNASPGDRRAIHQALAQTIDPVQDPVRRAWHMAAAAVGPDESVAASLDLAAKEALARNAYAAASHAHQRAAELTADPGRQVSRLIAAGQAAHLSGDLPAAARLLRWAVKSTADPCIKADAQAMLAHATIWTTPLNAHYDELVAEADTVLPFDPQRAAILLALAASLCCMIGQLSLALETATRAVSLCRRSDGIPWLMSQTWLAYATILTGDRAAGRQFVTGISTYRDMTSSDPAIHLSQMICGHLLVLCEDYKTAADVLRSSVVNGRVLGRVADLPYGLAAFSDLRFRIGEWSQAYADAAEAVELGRDFATTNDLCYALVCLGRVEAAMGTARPCRTHLSQALSLARQAGVDPIKTYAAAALGLLELGLAHHHRAAAELTRAASLVLHHGLGDPHVIQWRPDYIESLARTGRLADARQQLAVLDTEASATGSAWAQAAAARCRGLVQDTPDCAVAELEKAVTMAETLTSEFEQARTRLCFGEALSRTRRRDDARCQLEQARVTFELVGAQPWARRAAAELAAAGITVAPQYTPVHVRLTPQELRVAIQVADGLTNHEVATRLFLSPKTIEVHLSHIYDKLGVRSRTSLARLITTGAVRQ